MATAGFQAGPPGRTPSALVSLLRRFEGDERIDGPASRLGPHKIAVVLGVGGGLVATLGGYLGGHLTLVRKIGTADVGFGLDPMSFAYPDQREN